MKKSVIFLGFLLVMIFSDGMAQRFITKAGNINFYSSTPMEDIIAKNETVQMALDSKSGDVVAKVLMKSFVFEKALMQEHFNENYVESDTYPLSTFKAKIIDIEKVDFNKSGEYDVWVKGILTMHGEQQEIIERGKVVVAGEVLQVISEFVIRPEDYRIKVPKAVRNNIAKSITVNVDCKLKKL